MSTTKFHVDNIKCMGCVDTVKSALEGMEGCDSAKVDLETGIAEVSGDVSPALVIESLAAINYPATALA